MTRRVVNVVTVLLSLGACTLTEDDFSPLEAPVAESMAVRGAEEQGPAPTEDPAEPLDTCGSAGACPADRVCVDGTCVTLACSEAEDISACEISACLDGSCASSSCSDGELSVGEVDVDCGGLCPACGLGQVCTQASDCRDAECVAGRCAIPTCADGVQNQDERGTDCGGVCGGCPVGSACGLDADCDDGLSCPPDTLVCTPASCGDGLQNGAELDVDCGGGLCGGCPDESACAAAADCLSGVCGADARCAAASCSDATKNGDETDVDCGGSCPGACDAGAACGTNGDCASSVCGAAGCAVGVAQCCQAPSCTDGVVNGTEPVVDCGNAQCGRCELGNPCTANGQCESGLCGGARVCVPNPVCDDGVVDGDEGDVDCGGTEAGCPRCEDGLDCNVADDCDSGRCAAGLCVSCSDGIQNGNEAGIDCGGFFTGCAACPRCNEDNSADLPTTGVTAMVPANSCVKIAQFPGYSPTVIESGGSGPFPVPLSWSQSCSGQSGAGTLNGVFQQVPMPGVSTACPIVLDLRGSPALVELRWF
jgi:hypothetical protein